MERDPFFEKSINLPLGYAFTARARPSTIRKTAVKLLPWALYAAMPQGRGAKIALAVAMRLSPMMKQKVRK